MCPKQVDAPHFAASVGATDASWQSTFGYLGRCFRRVQARWTPLREIVHPFAEGIHGPFPPQAVLGPTFTSGRQAALSLFVGISRD